MSRGDVTLETDVGRLKALPEVAEQVLRVYWWVRKTVFTTKKSKNPYLVVQLTKQEAQEFFGKHHFEPGWEMSYSYRGEILNLRRVEWAHVSEFPDLPWWQVHIRGYRQDNPPGLEITAHFEAEPAEHPKEHLEHLGIDVPRGTAVMQAILDEAGIEYEPSRDWYDQWDEADRNAWGDDGPGVDVEVE